ncbi:MAG: c-type cytochrome, partial [Anaerolineales bacterium]
TRPFAGGLFPVPDVGFSATGSNLTPDPATGIGNWTEQQFMTAMRTGLRPDGTVMLPYMPYPSYSRWNEDDLHAVWLYLSSLEPIAHEIPAPTLSGAADSGTGAERGEGLFEVYCVVCHGEKGSGSPFTTVALQDVVSSVDDTNLSAFISEGLSGTAMPGFGKTLTEDQIADLVAFMHTW